VWCVRAAPIRPAQRATDYSVLRKWQSCSVLKDCLFLSVLRVCRTYLRLVPGFSFGVLGEALTN